jgi:protein arginine kinase activator
MKCRACPKAAVLHITEVLPDDRFEELHFCEECGRRYLYAAPESGKASKVAAPDETDEFAEAIDAAALVATEAAGLIEADGPDARPCEVCGLKFVEFRNSGRLGCPHDYDHFREELLPLLESIHGDAVHAGKTPKAPARPTPKPPRDAGELTSLRKKLTRAVKDEDYEAAARLRDRIRELEGV